MILVIQFARICSRWIALTSQRCCKGDPWSMLRPYVFWTRRNLYIGGSVKLEGCPYQCWKVLGFGGQVRLRSDAAFLVAVVKRQTRLRSSCFYHICTIAGLDAAATVVSWAACFGHSTLCRRLISSAKPICCATLLDVAPVQFSTAVYTHFL